MKVFITFKDVLSGSGKDIFLVTVITLNMKFVTVPLGSVIAEAPGKVLVQIGHGHLHVSVHTRFHIYVHTYVDQGLNRRG